MSLLEVALLLIFQWATTDAFGMPRLPGLYFPDLCLPMTDHSYTGDPDGDLSQEVISHIFQGDTLFCKRGCCGDSKEAECCPPQPEEGLGTFQLISIVAAGIAGVTVVTVIALYFVKVHNKKKVLVGDINSINKMNKKGGGGGKGGKGGPGTKGVEAGRMGKVGQYEKAPTFRNSQQQGQLFRKSTTPPDMKRPKSPISMVSPPDILPTFMVGPPSKLSPMNQLPNISHPSMNPHQQQQQYHHDHHHHQQQQHQQQRLHQQQQQQELLIANLKAPSPPASTNIKPVSPAPSPPLPANLPPPLISAPPFRTAQVDDDFIDTILASIPMEDPDFTHGHK